MSFFTLSFWQQHSKEENTEKKLDVVLRIKHEIKYNNLSEKEFDYIAIHDEELKAMKSHFFKSYKSILPETMTTV